MTINLREGRKSDSQNFCITLLKISSSQQKITSYVKKQESMSPTQNKNEISLQKLSLRNLLDKDLKTAILSMFKELKKSCMSN